MRFHNIPFSLLADPPDLLQCRVGDPEGLQQPLVDGHQLLHLLVGRGLLHLPPGLPGLLPGQDTEEGPAHPVYGLQDRTHDPGLGLVAGERR